MLSLRTQAVKLVLLGFPLVALVRPAAAQTYSFSSCQNAVSLTVKINSVVSLSGPNPDGQGGHNTNLIFFGDFTLTSGGSTQTYSNVVGDASIGYTPTIGNLTTFLIEIAKGGPINLQAVLQGTGDLIPDGKFDPTLPALPQWNTPGRVYIGIGSPTKFYTIDAFGNCWGGTGTPIITSVISAGAFGAFTTITPGTWIEIYGSNLAPDTRSWASSDFNGIAAPTDIDHVEVTINGEKAFVGYIQSSPGQVNVQVPSDIPTGGNVNIVVNNNGVASAPFSVMVKGVQPGLLAPPSFVVNGKQYVTALLPDGSYVLPTGAIAGVNSRPAKPGETIVLYGIGFGLVIPPSPAGFIAPANTKLALPLQVLFGQTPAMFTYEGLAPGYVGLYQFNVVVPPVPDNDLVPLTVNLVGTNGAQTLYIAVHS
ncbi:MAG TPA: IPT/TIG domain-containing protein [Bryobacteraceae bacterium]|nr:IPT/TIG domain-containing protein [Bryobacteraceae bacterium]